MAYNPLTNPITHHPPPAPAKIDWAIPATAETMNPLTLKLTRLAALAAAVLLLATGSAKAAIWLDADIGSPEAPESHTKVGSTLTVTGAGSGDHQGGGDQLHYTYLTIPAGGDIDVTVRIADFSGAPHARATRK